MITDSIKMLSMVTRIGPKKAFRHYIKEWMKHRSLNRDKIAGRMEVENSTISKLLNGKMRMSDVWLTGFAEALDLEVADLFRDPNAPTQEELFEGLEESDKETVIQLIHVLREKAVPFKGPT